MLGATDKTQGEEPACRHILATSVIARCSCALALRHLLPHRKPMLWLTTPRTLTQTQLVGAHVHGRAIFYSRHPHTPIWTSGKLFETKGSGCLGF